LQEISRVLRKNGQLMVINEPVRGWLRWRQNFGAKEKKLYGVNEHLYS